MWRVGAILWVIAASAGAETPGGLAAHYAAEAAAAQPKYAPSESAGREFFLRRFNISAEMPSCSTCHTENPAARGRHAITNKRIPPLTPGANPDRFTDAAHVEKWFRRNCTEVVGRECTAAEKSDFIAFLMAFKP